MSVRPLLGVLLLSAVLATASAHHGDPQLEGTIDRLAGHPRLTIASNQTAGTMQRLLDLTARFTNADEDPLLPPGTRIDRVAWRGPLLEMRLTMPAEADWRLSSNEMTAISQVFARPFMGDDRFAGVDLQVRPSPEAAYGPLSQFVPRVPDVQTPQPNDVVDLSAESVAGPGPQASIGGPTASGRQPSGALSGVTVYVSAGHGWTVQSGAWALQRPVLLGMAEDYGNLDQMNYFVQFAHNAGATVVPLRPAGWQPLEITLDNDDPGVSYTGTWTDSGSGVYYENGTTLSGTPYRFASTAASESATARYTPTIGAADFYPVYTFVVASTNRVPQVYRIQHSGGLTEMTVDHREVGNGWVWLGEYFFDAGTSGYVEISNESPVTGVVVADGIRFGGGYGDIVRPGPGTISGYPREEEATRYWGQHVYGNETVGFSSTIWETASDDYDDNIGTGARIAREMNQVPAGGVSVDRWKRVHLEFHTNAFNGAARGQLTLISTNPTSNQASFADILSDEVDADMDLLDADFEHAWVDRVSSTLTGGYGAISTTNNSNEFDATLVELAFHDNQEDAELLRDARVRRAMARACVHGIIRFLNTLPGSQVTLDFAPDTPQKPRVEDLGGGDVRISWAAPLSDGARGDAATGYVVYESTNGFGFGNPTILGNVTSVTLSGVPVEETRYYRVAATNAGGESMPTEVLAVRRPASGVADLLLVNGFDRNDRFLNGVQDFTQPAAYAGLSIERQQWRRSNAYNYVIEHADALAAGGYAFASTSNEAVADVSIDLNDYDAAIWILGRESTGDETFSAVEQLRVENYLNAGGSLLVSGSNIVFDLVNQSGGVSFAQNVLHVSYVGDDAGTFDVTPTAGGIFDGMAAFDFDPANGAAYETGDPDQLASVGTASACLAYVGGAGGAAAVQYAGPSYNVVVLGFPFETITSGAVQADVMQRVLDFLATSTGPLEFDFDNDGDVDFTDFQVYAFCSLGPDNTFSSGNICLEMDGDGDSDVDTADFLEFQVAFTGP